MNSLDHTKIHRNSLDHTKRHRKIIWTYSFSLYSVLIPSFQHSGLSFDGYIIRAIKSRRESWAELLARKEKVKACADFNRGNMTEENLADDGTALKSTEKKWCSNV
jgi:hypothetical protein